MATTAVVDGHTHFYLMEVLVSAMPCFVLQSLFYITAGLRPALFWHCLCQSHIGVVPLICLLFSCM
jgi:hypothetical protein